MALQLKKAERKKAKLKLGMSAPSGGGKTLGALLIAFGLMKEKYPNLPEEELWGKIAIIDSENGSGELYSNTEKADVKIGQYCAISLEPPFTPEKYIEGINLCYKEGIEVCIIDSTSHLWSGQGGLLEQQGNIAKRQGYNSYTAWRDVTPLHNKFVDTMLQTDIHIIATMRAKQEYVQEKDEKGNTKIRKVGLNPIQRDGMEYEFTAFLEIDADHMAFGSKDRTGIVDQQYFKITPETGRQFMRWLESGVDTSIPAQVIAESKTDEKLDGNKKDISSMSLDELKATLLELSKAKAKIDRPKLLEILKDYKGNPSNIKDLETAKKIYEEINNIN